MGYARGVSVILVTGERGFVGRHVCAELGERGLKWQGVGDIDLRDEESCDYLIRHLKPEAIIHLAAHVGGIGLNREKPADLFYDNLIMGMNIIHSASGRVDKLVLLGTVCCYPKLAPIPFMECDLWNGYPEETNAPYGIAKKALLVMAQAYRKQYGLDSIFLIPTNLYGEGDDFSDEKSHVIPALIKKFVAAKETDAPNIMVWGTGQVTRDFLYAHDAARAIVLALEKYDAPEPLNLGSGIEIYIGSLVRMIAEICSYSGEIIFDTTMPDGQPRRCVDSSRAAHTLGWHADMPLSEGLVRTIAWYREHRG